MSPAEIAAMHARAAAKLAAIPERKPRPQKVSVPAGLEFSRMNYRRTAEQRRLLSKRATDALWAEHRARKRSDDGEAEA